MPVFVYDKSGLVEERPETEHKQVGQEIHRHNLKNPKKERKLFVGSAFPPPAFTFDAKLGDLRRKTITESLKDGDIEIPEGYRVEKGAAGEVLLSPEHKLGKHGRPVKKTTEELVRDGHVEFNSKRQKIVDNKIVQKSTQDLLDDGEITIDDLRELMVQRLRAEVEAHFRTARTPKGMRVDSLARQKASISFQYRHVENADAAKKKLIADRVIYDDEALDEIMAETRRVQIAYDKAKSALQAVYDAGQPAAKFEDINLETYL